MFQTFKNKGFHIKFENNVNVSVQFGFGNYCENYRGKNTNRLGSKSKDAEVAIWYQTSEGRHWITRRYCEENDIDVDDVIPHQSPAEVLKILIWASSQAKIEEVEDERSNKD